MTHLAARFSYSGGHWFENLPDWAKLPVEILIIAILLGMCAWGFWGPK